jgi:hypothetical protein
VTGIAGMSPLRSSSKRFSERCIGGWKVTGGREYAP